MSMADWRKGCESAQVQVHQPHQRLRQGFVSFCRELHGSTAGKAQFALPIVEPQPPLFECPLRSRVIGHVHELKRGDGRSLYPQPLVDRGFSRLISARCPCGADNRNRTSYNGGMDRTARVMQRNALNSGGILSRDFP